MTAINEAEVLILGAGASGLMCAIQAASRGRKVLVLDHARTHGRKLRISGGGRCNCTNLGAGARDYICANPHFVKSALAQYAPHDFVAWAERHGLKLRDMGKGMLFGRDAGLFADALYRDADDMGASFRFSTQILAASASERGFSVRTDQGSYVAESLVIALGGPAWPQIGATDKGHGLAESLGLVVTELRPGLVPLLASRNDLSMCREMSGNTFEVVIHPPHPAQGSLLFTHRGISGPAVLDASLFWLPGQHLSIDWLPGVDIAAHLRERPKMHLANALAQLLTRRFAKVLCDRHGWQGQIASMPGKVLLELEELLHRYPFAPDGTEGFRKAEVTLGGVDTDQLSSKTMEVKKMPGLYCIGEVLDVAGRLGGYNLQWAWSSGYVAGQYA